MFKINSKKQDHKEYIIIENKELNSYASICLDEGARITNLTLAGKSVISEQPNFKYASSYASSILFPFASRLKEGKYHFIDSSYELEKNDNNVNALHGLVYNKKFTLFEPEEHIKCGSATFNYYESNPEPGFPFKYFLSVTYTLYADYLHLNITVKNVGESAFPFTLGWHPYLNCNDFSKAKLNFASDKKVVFDDTLITKSIENEKTEGDFLLAGKELDDCFILTSNEVDFTTDDYQVKLTSDAAKNFLQLYTPKDIPVIAVEPMTGISDSFNNKVGLQVLEPNKTYTVNWKLKLMQN